ncbi:phospholipase A [Desulfogranum marinum]|uniref:phospholipase A n=1 Tax=Desulfogranum marinum TaxID=453220 RepID=UPI001963A36C|nr:phospholipase A [Desulfogranum marinum]MBM9514482.1 phospholipase A [Desulfogranum marinum]
MAIESAQKYRQLLFLQPFISLCILLCIGVDGHAASFSTPQECIQHLILTGPDTMTMGEARAACNTTTAKPDDKQAIVQKSDGPVEGRLKVDKTNLRKPFTLMSHKNNYILFAAYNFQGWDITPYAVAYGQDGLEIDNAEVQFQLSIKTPLAVELFDQHLDIFAGYTARSFWQVFNKDASSPFRETNHEPEIWLQERPQDRTIFGFKNTVNAIGFNHMSNGQGGSLSRSWNRIYGFSSLERGNLAIILRPWIRIAEDVEEDDNPDITDYYGHGELWLSYKHNRHTFSFMTRNNLESGFSRGAVSLDWSFPLFGYPYLKGYIQYFTGYGESLIDYNKYVNRIGIGLQFTDFL